MIKARIKFSKSGSMKFIGHLDVMRYFQKAIRRAGIDVAYSQGYSPHQLLSFASPLGVGLTSDGEYLDMQLNSISSSGEIKERLNSVMSEEIQVLEVKVLPEESKTAMSMLAAADYQLSLKDGYPSVGEHFEKSFLEFLQQAVIPVTKKTKRGETELDLKPLIYKTAFTREEFEHKLGRPLPSTTVEVYENGQKIYLQLICGSVINLKPEQVMEAFYCFLGQEYNPFAWQVHRMELYTDTNALKGEANPNGCGKERCLVPLDGFGILY